MEFSRQGYWSGLPFPSACDLPDPGMEPGSPAFQGVNFPVCWASSWGRTWEVGRRGKRGMEGWKAAAKEGRLAVSVRERESEMKCSLLSSWEWVGSGREGESHQKGVADVCRVFSAPVDMSGAPDGSLAWLGMRTPLEGWRPWEAMSQPSQLLFAEYQPFGKQCVGFRTRSVLKPLPGRQARTCQPQEETAKRTVWTSRWQRGALGWILNPPDPQAYAQMACDGALLMLGRSQEQFPGCVSAVPTVGQHLNPSLWWETQRPAERKRQGPFCWRPWSIKAQGL